MKTKGQSTLLLIICLLIAHSALAQNPQASLQIRDPQALALIQRSLSAMMPSAPADATNPIHTIVIQGTLEKLDGTGAWVPGTFRYVDDLSGKVHEYHREAKYEQHDDDTVSNHGNPRSSNDVKSAVRHPHRVAEPDYFPYILLYQASTDTTIGVQNLGQVQSEGKTLIHIMTVSSDDATKGSVRRDWYIDQATALPAVSLFILPSAYSSTVQTMQRVKYSDFQQVGGALYPMEQTITLGTAEAVRVHIHSVDLNKSIQSNEFEFVGTK